MNIGTCIMPDGSTKITTKDGNGQIRLELIIREAHTVEVESSPGGIVVIPSGYNKVMVATPKQI